MQGLTRAYGRKAALLSNTTKLSRSFDQHEGHHGQGHTPAMVVSTRKNMQLHSTLTIPSQPERRLTVRRWDSSSLDLLYIPSLRDVFLCLHRHPNLSERRLKRASPRAARTALHDEPDYKSMNPVSIYISSGSSI